MSQSQKEMGGGGGGGGGVINNKGIMVITRFRNGDAIENFVAFCILVAWFE